MAYYFSLSREGAVEICPVRDGPWSIKINPLPNSTLKGDLFHSDHFLNSRVAEFEQTLSTEKDWTRHFFLLPRSVIPDTNAFTMRVQNEGVGQLDFDKEKQRLIFKDGIGKPVLQVAGEFKLVDGRDIVVTFPPNSSFPLAIVFGLTSKVLSDDESLGLKLSTEESDESGESDDETNGKFVKRKIKFPELPSPSLKIGEKRSKHRSLLLSTDEADKKVGRRRSMGMRFVKSIFGDKTNSVHVEGETTTINAPSGGQTVFHRDGSADFTGPEWELRAVPLTLSSSPSLCTLGNNNLEFTKGDSFAISKQDLWEGGISLKNDCSNHYFKLAAAPDDGTFSLKLNTQGLHGSYDSDTGFVIFLSKKDMPQLVYVPALLKQANEVVTSIPLTWSEADNTYEVDIGLGMEMENENGSGNGKKGKLHLPKLRNGTHIKMDKKLRSLYGKIDPAHLDTDFKINAKSATLVSPGTDLQFLLGTDGVFTVAPAKANAAQQWSVRIVPSQSGWGDDAQMYKGGSFVAVRNPNVEQGASTFADTTKHFFLLPKGGSYSLKFEGNGTAKIQHDKSGKTFFSNAEGHPLFVYSKPSFRMAGKKVVPKTNWDEQHNELHIEVPNVSTPIGVVCAVCTCTLPPSDVIYASDDGFYVIHPRVSFIGHAGQDGVSYKPLKAEDNPWNITFSLENSKVSDIYAKSKCTVAVVRTNNITEYLSYVDRGEYLGLHHSFHVIAPPANTDATLHIPIAITQKGITEVTQNAGDARGALTFHTAQGPVFSFERMTVCDAHGTVLHSQMHHYDGKLVLEVLEQGEYPLVIS